jgi:hypothetical protein
MDQEMFVIKTFYCSRGSCVALKRQCLLFRVKALRRTVYRTVKQFEEAGSLCHKRAKGRKHSASVREEEFVGEAREAITRSGRQSVR